MYNTFNNWLSFGLPLLSFPSIGSKKWDGDRWVSEESPSYSDGTYRFDVFGEGGLDSPGLSAGFGDATGLAGTNSLAGDRAADAIVGSFGKAALGAGAKTGLGMAFGMNPSDALAMGAQSLAGPGTLGGIVGAGINAGLGLDSLGYTQAALTGVASLFGGPLAGAAVAALGGFLTNAIADFADVRAMEQTKDSIENTYGHGIRGLSVGEDISSTAKNATSTQSSPQAALSIGQSLADNGLAVSPSAVLGLYGDIQNDLFGDLAPNMAPLSADDVAAVESFGVLGGLAQTNYGIQDADPAPTSVHGGMTGSPAGSIGTPGQDSLGAAISASVTAASDSMSLGDSVSSAVANAEAAAAEAAAMGDSASEGSDTGGGNDGGGNGDGPSGDSDGDSAGGDHGAASPGDGPGEA